MGGMICSVAACKSVSTKAKKTAKYWHFLVFLKTRREWIRKCYRKDKFNPVNKRVCSRHSKNDDFEDYVKAKLMGTHPKKLKNSEFTNLKTYFSENLFIFTKEQVRVLLFRECDFRGRKLLFDSESVQKISLAGGGSVPTTPTTKSLEKYVEVSNGYGYQYIKPCCDIGHLGEMVFGAVAMSYRGTSLKIHSLKSPSRLMCSQIFPSPRHPSRRSSQSYHRSSATSCQSLEHSIRLDDSGASSTTSTSDRLSVHSTGSDALLVCRGTPSVPLDVPISSNHKNLTPSAIGDSGFSGEQSYNSISSGLQSFPLCCLLHEGEQQSFSCGSLYKKWLRSTSTSLEHSSTSLAGSASADECILKTHPRSSKLGLAIIIELPLGQEQVMELFLMEHASLIESMVWRARQGVEIAYIRHSSFVSLMFEVATTTTQWLIDLLSGPQLSNHMWISLAPICDKFNSINNGDNIRNNFNNLNFNGDTYNNNNNNKEMCLTMSLNVLEDRYANDIEQTLTKKRSSISLNSFKCENNFFEAEQTVCKSADFTFLNLTRFLRNEFATVCVRTDYSCDKSFMAEKCVTELCELLDCIDVKHTNFFISTLVTAVLTHHLGWVSTVLPPSFNDKEKLSKLHNPCNPLWGQLTDLYGAIGHPTKVSHTIVTGTNKSDLISKILNSLTYFIRCNDTERKCLTRLDIKEENKMVDCICQQKSCIPKENYKKYEDHLREMEFVNNNVLSSTTVTNNSHNVSSREENNLENMEMCNLNSLHNKIAIKNKHSTTETSNFNLDQKHSKPSGLSKSHTCITELSTMNCTEAKHSSKRLYPCLEEFYEAEDVHRNEAVTTPVHHIQDTTNPHALLDKVKQLGIQAVDAVPLDKSREFELTTAIINEKVRKLCRVPTSAVMYHLEESNEAQLVDIHEASTQVRKVFAPKKINMEKQMKSNFRSYTESIGEAEENKKNVIFVLGDNEELVGLKRDSRLSLQPSEKNTTTADSNVGDNNGLIRPTTLNIARNGSSVLTHSDELEFASNFSNQTVLKHNAVDNDYVKPSTSWTSVDESNVVIKHSSRISLESEYGSLLSKSEKPVAETQKEFCRSQSVPPDCKREPDTESTQGKSKYRYSGVKFNFQQYPQIVTNYMRSKNLELPQIAFSEKAMKLNTLSDYPDFDFGNCNSQMEEVEILQTPSNASELEFTSDLVTDNYDMQHAKQVLERKPKTFVRNQLPNTVIKEPFGHKSNSFNLCKKVVVLEHPLQVNETVNNAIFEQEECNHAEDFVDVPEPNKMKIIELPMPKSEPIKLDTIPINYTSSLMRGIGDRYISNMVLQGTSAPKSEWESSLRRDLSLAARHPLLDQPVDEAIAIVANTDTWEVQLLSSHTYIVDRGSSGIRVGMSQLVANMLESLLQMWKLRTPPQYCIMHLEQKLQEFCVLSKSLAELLLATEFCSMDLLTSVLQLEINDVPLLMAVASTHSPQLAQKYGLSFQ